MSSDRGIKFLEVCQMGDLKMVEDMVTNAENGNELLKYQHALNGWTGFHWACKRGHTKVVQYLTDIGAPQIKNHKGEIPSQLITPKSKKVLSNNKSDAPDFTPSYLTNPPLVSNPSSDTQNEDPVTNQVASIVTSNHNDQIIQTKFYIKYNSGDRTLSGSKKLFLPVFLDPKISWTYDYVVESLAITVNINPVLVKYIVLYDEGIILPKTNFCEELKSIIYQSDRIVFDLVVQKGVKDWMSDRIMIVHEKLSSLQFIHVFLIIFLAYYIHALISEDKSKSDPHV